MTTQPQMTINRDSHKNEMGSPGGDLIGLCATKEQLAVPVSFGSMLSPFFGFVFFGLAKKMNPAVGPEPDDFRERSLTALQE